jgi:hypothetical protein
MKVNSQFHALVALPLRMAPPVFIARLTLWDREKSLECRQSNACRPVRSESLYRLSYPDSDLRIREVKFVISRLVLASGSLHFCTRTRLTGHSTRTLQCFDVQRWLTYQFHSNSDSSASGLVKQVSILISYSYQKCCTCSLKIISLFCLCCQVSKDVLLIQWAWYRIDSGSDVCYQSVSPPQITPLK